MRCLWVALALSLSAGGAVAAELPCTQVRVVVPYPAGGAADVPARLVVERLGASLKKNIIIDNRPGATGNIGAIAVARSQPDGCTLLVSAAFIATNPHTFSNLAYDPLKDLAGVGGIGNTPSMFVTATASPASDLKQLLQWSKDKDGLSYGTAGYGLLTHLVVEEVVARTGAKMLHVPYRGGAQAAVDLMTGRVDFGSSAVASILPLLKQGKLKGLAVFQDKRSGLAPDVPTSVEQGFAGLNAASTFLLFAPAATPKDIIAMLSAEIKKITSDPTLTERFAEIGFEPNALTSDEVDDIMRKTADTWVPVVKRLKIKLD